MMDFRILGPLEVLESGTSLELGARKHRELLAMLLIHANEVVSIDRLIDALWEEEPPERAQKALQVYVSQLRKTLGRERVETVPPGYRLRVSDGELDVDRFQAALAEGRPDEALSLWRGEPLADVAYSRFARAETARLEELRLTAVEDRLDLDLAAGRHAQLVGELEALVTEHPLRERLRGQLMLAFYRSGRQADALEAYQDARRALTEELGIDPGRELRELQQRILNQDPALDLRRPAQSSPSRRRLSSRARVALVGGAVIVLAAAAGLGWLALRPSTGLPSGTWTVGVDMPLTGSGAGPYGIGVRNAVRLAIDEANAAGGVAGVDLALKAYDTSGEEGAPDPVRAAAAVREMANDPRTIAAVGPFTSPEAGETIPITNRAGLLECSPANSYAGLTKPEFGALDLRAAHPKRINYVRLSPTSDVLSPALAAFAAYDLDAESALLIVQDDPDAAAGFDEAFTALGGQVVRSRLAPDGDVSAALEPLRRAGAPDVVVYAGLTDAGAAKVRRAMRAAGLGATPLLMWDNITPFSGATKGSFLQRAGEAADGSYFGHTAIAPPRADFVSAYRAAFREEPSEYADAAYGCMQVILASLEGAAADDPSADELREAVRAHAVNPNHRYKTVLGTVGFDANGDSTQQMVSFYRVDPEAADGAGDWGLIKQQDFGPPQ